MKITQKVGEFAAERNIAEVGRALAVVVSEKERELAAGAEIYQGVVPEGVKQDH